MDSIFNIITLVLAAIIPQLKKKDSKEGIKETQELLVGINELAVDLTSRFMDGVQLADFSSFYSKLVSDASFKAKLEEAYNSANKIPDEVKDLDVGEGLELVSIQVNYIPKFIQVIQDKK